MKQKLVITAIMQVAAGSGIELILMKAERLATYKKNFGRC